MDTKFCYIEASQGEDNDTVKFSHLFVMAADAEEAYLLGGRMMDATTESAPYQRGALNDYVVAV